MIEEPVNAIIERVRPGYFDGSGVTPLPLPSTPGTAAALPVNARGQLAALEDRRRQQRADGDKIDESSEN
jgi:hypothetical protein